MPIAPDTTSSSGVGLAFGALQRFVAVVRQWSERPTGLLARRGEGDFVLGRSGDGVLQALAETRWRALTGYAFVLTGDLMAAEDLVQEALLKVFVRSRSGFTAEVAEAYVRRAILTLYIDGYRRRRHWASLRHLVGRDEVRDGHEQSATDRVDVRAALATLTTRERASVVLRFYEDLTVPDVADHMGVSAGAVKRYLSNAMVKLQGRLGPLADLDPDGAEQSMFVDLSTDQSRS